MIAVYILGVMRYFEAGYFSLNIRSLLTNSVYLCLCKILFPNYLAYVFLKDWISIVHFIFLSLGVDCLRTYIPKGLTFAESLSFLTVIGNFFSFFMESSKFQLNGTGKFLAGSNAHNIIIFSPVTSRFSHLYSGHAWS